MGRKKGLQLAAVAAATLVSAGLGAVDAKAEIKRFQPVADAHVSQAKKKANFGRSKKLVVAGSPAVRSYLRFNVRGLGGSVSYATLQLTAMSAGRGSVTVRRAAANHWDERRIRFSNAPRVAGPSVRVRSVRAFRTSSVDVTRLVRGNGVVTLVLSAGGRGAAFASGESLKALRPTLVVGVNEAPVCNDVILLTFEDTAGSADPPYCTDSERDNMTYHVVSQGAQGTASIVGGKLHYAPRPDTNGTDRFQYRAKDGKKFSKVMTVTVSIRGVNDAPTCAPRTLVVDEDGGGAIGHLCSDVDADGVTVSITSGAQKGTSTVVGGELRYQPNPNTNGADTFSYRARDTTLASAPATVTVIVRPVNDVPSCSNVAMATDEDLAVERDPSCTDIDGDALSYGIAAQGSKGTAAVVGGRLRYGPSANANNTTGPDTFTYFAFDGAAASPAAAASVDVAPVNDAPFCQPLPLETAEDTPREVNPNCVDIEGDPMSFSIVSQGLKGTASVSGGRLRYVPNLDLIGADSFTYRAHDAATASAATSVTVTIGAQNDRPTCGSATLGLSEDAAGQTAPVCSDLDGDTLTYEIVSQGTKGTASVVDGALRYVGNPNSNGADSFTYRANDGGLSSTAATVSVAITPVNDVPVCANVTLATTEDLTGERDPSCTDIDGDALTYATASQGTKGAASVVAGRLRYVPNANANGPDSFTYQARDGALTSAVATVSVTVAAVNDAPTCAGVSLTTDEDVTGEQNPSCTDIDGDALTYAIVAQGTKGTASVVTGRLRFVPSLNANGPDSFTYRASDGAAQSAPATVTTTIRSVNDAPVCTDVTLATNEDVTGERDPVCSDVEGDVLTYSTASQGTKGVASVVTGRLRYVPNPNLNGPDSFTYRASDGVLTSGAAGVAVTIAAVNDAPTCANVALTTDEDVAAERDPSCADIDGDAITYAIAGQGAKGAASIAVGRLRYVPAANANGPDSFTYRASDGALNSAPATVSVTILAVNDLPACANVALPTSEDVIGERDPACTDIDNDPLSYVIVAQGTKGVASIAADKLRYTPQLNVNGSDSFTYRANDGIAASPVATASVTIASVNDAPVCASVSFAMNEEVTVDQDPSCTDVDADALTYAIVASATKGVASVVAGKLRYDPNVNANGPDSFTYRASDGAAQSSAAAASVSITPVNDVPTCTNVGLATNEDVTGERDPVCTDVDGDALTYSTASQGTKGAASVVLGRLRYVPNANANGPDSFTYRASDGTLTSAAATVSVTIAAVNDVPVCGNVSLTTPEDVTSERDPACTDSDGDALTYVIVAQGTRGTASIASGRLRYVPDANVNGTDAFTYNASDGVAQSAAASAGVTITPVNDAPVCSPVSISIDEDGSDSVAPNCTEADGDALSYVIATQGTKGTASVDAGNLRYVANPNAAGTDSFTYRASDGTLMSAPASVAVTIGAVNDPPVCSPRTLTIDEDGVGTVSPLCTDPEGQPITYSISVQGTKGVASVTTAGELRYVPNPNANGTDTFSYRASDEALAGAPAAVSVTIRPVNDAPVCANVALAISEDTAGERDPSCTDVDGDVLTYSIAGQGAKGTASINAGRLRFVPNTNANGPDSFTYQARDGVLTSAAATVSVTIAAVNDAPVCQPLPLDTPEDTPREINPDCADIESEPLSYSIVSQGTKGTASVAGGRLRYVPNLNLLGTDSFTYRAHDATTASAAATVSVTINPVNDAPVCVARTLALDEDGAGTSTPSCTDVDGDTLTYSIAAQGTKGTASVVGGNLRFAGNLDSNGADSFTYQASDSELLSAAANVSVTINPVNDAPVCTDVSLAASEDVIGERDPACTDVDGDTLTPSIVAQGTKGTASVVSGKLRYLSNANANGADAFTYRSSDGVLASGPASVSVTIAAVNDAPSCAPVALTTDEDVAGERDPSCTDVDGDPLTYSIVAQGTKGTASIAGGKLRYLSNANANGADSFTYRASDGPLSSAAATVSVTVNPINDAPTCVNVALTTNEDVTGERDPSCTDIDANPLTYSIAAQGTKGTASVVAGRLRFVPAADANGADSFTYRASDGTLSSAPATVSVTITPVNDAPVCANVTLATDEDAFGERDPSCSDIDGAALTYSIASQGAKGTASIAAGKLRYVPSPNATGPDTFGYAASDGVLTSAAATVSVTIAPINDTPACANVSLTTLEDTPAERDPSCADIEGTPLAYSIVGQGTKGTASVTTAGKLRYVPNTSATGADSFTYQASDGPLTSPIATVSVTITPSNDPPDCENVTLTTDEDVVGESDPSCTDIDGDTLTYEIVSQGTKGTASIAAGKLHYVPNANVVGTDSFTYRALDFRSTSGSATVSVTIRPVNDAPVCASVSLTTDEDAPAERDPSCSDIDGDPLTYQIASAAAKGTPSVVGTRLRYVPNANANGSDSFGYQARDGSLTSTAASVSVTIRPVNDTPVCSTVPLSTDEEVAAEVDPSCVDADGDSLTYSVLSQGTKGSASVTTAGKLRYVPSQNATGADSFTYRADDAVAISAAATVSVTIRPVNDAPTCAAVALTTDEDVPGERDPSCTDIDGDSLTYTIVAQGAKGTASVTTARKLRFVPNLNLNGPDSFTYRASDGTVTTAPATASVTIQAVNDAPVCQSLPLSTPEETPAEIDPSCSDVEGDSLTYSIVGQGTKGTASVTTAGRLRYAPSLNVNGADSFTYRARDAALDGAPAAISVTIGAINDPPSCANIVMSTDEDSAAERTPSCSDVDGDLLAYSIAAQGAKGSASVTTGGLLRYVPNANANGADSFTYRASDGPLSSVPATVSVTIQAINDAPVCANVTLTTNEEVTGERDPSCTDFDGDTLSYAIVSQGAKGTASVVGGKLRYAPSLNANGADSFTYRALDSLTISGLATASVTINPVNDAPTCSDVALATNEDLPGERDPVCADIDGDTLVYSIVAQGARGTASVTTAGKLRYVPNPNANGADSFTYRAGDGATLSSPATVSVTIAPVNDGPICPAQSLTVDEDGDATITPVCSDPEGQPVSLEITGQGLKGTASVVGNALRFDASADANGTDSFTYRGTDGSLAGPSANVSVTIRPVNDAPVCAPVALATDEDAAAERDPSCTDIDGDSLAYAIVAPGSKGTASVTTAGRLRYVPNLNATGADSFTYQASDGALVSAAATVSVSIGPVNDAPTCTAVGLTTAEDVPGERDPSCTDLDGDSLTYSIVAGGTKGTASVTTAGRLRYVPNLNANGGDSFTYRASDGPLSSAPATVSVTITAVNDAPTCAGVSLTTNEDVTAERDPSCADVDADSLSYSIVTPATKGTASVLGGKLRYTPSSNATGADSFTYQASDGGLSSAPATVSVTITPVNDAPTCSAVPLTTDEDVPAERDPSCADIDSGSLTYSIVAQGSKGAASVTTAGRLRYAPNLNATGADSFTYQASDGGLSSAAATVSVMITPVNDAPTCANVGLTTDEDVAGERDPSCADVDSGSLTYSIVAQGSKGAASVTTAGRLRYVPNLNATGPDSFTYQASDGSLSSGAATVSVTITAGNDAPTCAAVALTTDEDVPAERDPSCADIDSGSLAYSIVAGGAKGTASVTAGGKLRYVPNLNATGSDSFTYKANDGGSDSNVATVSVTITAVNDPPVAQNLSATTPEDTAKAVVLDASDVEGTPLSYTIVAAPTHGTLSGTGANRTYTPNANYHGPDSFTYKANDGPADSNVATVSVTVTPVNDPPVAQNLSATTPEDTAKALVLAGSDVEGSSLSFTIVTPPAHGTLSGTDANRTYTPSANYHGPDSFTYRANDGTATSNLATASLTVSAVNDPPVAQDVSVSAQEDTATDLVLDSNDVDNDPLTFTIVTPPAHGTLSGTGADLTYTPEQNYTGPDSFTYQANDGSVDSNIATVTVDVTAVNDPPRAQDLTASTPEDTPKVVVLAAMDVDSDILGFTITTPPVHGRLLGSGTNWTYTPDLNYHGPDSFTYRAGDGLAESNVATVSITVTPVNDAPDCPAQALTVDEDSQGTVTPVCSDPEGQAVSLEIIGQGTKGAASVVGNSLRYVAAVNANGSDSFTYRASDGALASAAATVSVTITPVNDAPTCANVGLTTGEDVAGERDPSCTDIDSGSLTYSIASQGSKGTASVTAGRLRYVPNLNATGADSFTYRASDGPLSSAPATVSVTITAVNDAPTCANVALSTNEDVAGERDPSCADVDSGSLTYSIVAQGSKGTASVTTADRLRYAPNLNATGADSFTYQATDGALASAPATVSVTITAVNDAPTCAAVALTTDEDVAGERDPSCADVDSGSLTYAIVAQGSKGTASVATAGKLRYVPNLNATGSDSFTYRASDGGADSNVATVTVTITAINDAPVAQNLSVSTPEDTAKAVVLDASDAENDPLGYAIVVGPTHGSLSGAGANRTYTPDANYFGPDSFTYRANDGTVDSNVATVSVNVTAVNDPPVAQGLTASTAEDTPRALSLTATDVESSPLGYSIVTAPTHGTLSGTGANRTYTPDLNYNGPDSFTFKANDGAADSNVATVSMTVTPVNDAPSCPARTLTIDEDSEGSLTPVCSDPEGQALSLEIVGQGARGVASVVGNALRYVASANANGADSFTYRASDGALAGAAATVTVTITPVNDAPVCANVSLVTDEDVPGERDPSCSDIDGGSLTYSIVAQGSKGTASVTSAPRLRYVPNLNASGADSFTYRASDGSLASAPATVSVTINPVNDAPICPAQSMTLDEDTDATIAPVCTDPDSGSVTLQVATQPLNGTVSVVGSSLRFVPSVDWHGSDSFTYRASDGALVGPASTVSVTVRPVNDEPDATPLDVSTDKGVAKVITLQGFDSDNDPLSFRILSLPANGGLRAGPTAGAHLITPSELPYALTGSQVRYEPNAGFTGSNLFQFRAHDGVATSLPADVQISVTGTNAAPVCSSQAFSVDEDGTLTDEACTDPDGDDLTFTETGPANGQLTLFEDGSFEYVPDQNYHGPDSFTVVARDGSGLTSSLATITITVDPVNDAPTCRPFTLLTSEDTPGLRFADCEDADEDALTYTIVGQGTKGTASVEPDGRLRYVPNPNENGADAFTFTVSDGVATTGPHTAQVSITAVNDAPTCNSTFLTTSLDSPGATFADCEDVDGDLLTYHIVDPPARGTASVDGQELGYGPDAGFLGGDSFTYRASDGTLFSAPATVTVDVTL